jgi:molybdenum cofactor cytidylyltransferase
MSDLTIGAVLLAAGQSDRFGSGNKLLATLDGRAVVSHAANTLTDAALDGRIVVVGHDGAAVRAAVPDDFAVRENDRYAEGQHTSVRAGVAAAREAGWDGVLFALGDMPAVDPATVEALCAAFADDRGPIVVPTVEQRRGNPVLFGASQFDALAAVSGDTGGRALVERHPDTVRVPVDDSGIHRDIDTPADVETFAE